MRKLTALVLALCMILCLAACGGGGSTPSNNGGNTVPANNSANSTENTTPTNNAANNTAVVRGAVSGKTYVNKSLDVSLKVPDTWTFADDDYIAQITGISSKLLDNTNIGKALDDGGQVMDMYAANGSGIGNMNLVLQKKPAAAALYTDEQMFKSMETTLKDQFSAAGFTISDYEVIKAKFRGEEKAVLHTILSSGSTSMDQYQVWLRPDGDYMGILTVSGIGMKDPSAVFSWFGFADGKGMENWTDFKEPEPAKDDTPSTNRPDIGKTSGTVYTNDFFNLKLTLPKGWTLMTEDQLAQYNSITTEQLRKTDFTNQVTVLYAQESKTNNSINIIINSSGDALSAFSDEQLFNLAEDSTIESLKAQGYTVKLYEVQKAKFMGEERAVIRMDLEVQGISFTEYQFWLRPEGKYCAIVTFGGVTVDPAPFYNMFSTLK